MVFIVLGLVLVVLVGAVALVMSTGDDSDDGDRTETAERNESGDEPSDSEDTDGSDGGNGGAGDAPMPPASTASPPDATSPPPEPATSTTPRAPAQAAVGECIEVTPNGNVLSKGACSPAGPPYKVTAVVDSPQECPSPNAGATPSGDYLLCLELNLFETYCYVIPESGDGGWSGFITPATACEASGTVHIIDIVHGASNGDACTRDFQWNRWYGIPAPQGVICVMEY